MKFFIKNKKLIAIFFWVWVLIILYFSVTPTNINMQLTVKEGKSLRLDYFFHFMVYFSLSFLFFLWQTNHDLDIKRSCLIYFLICALFFSGFSEYLQSFIPGRTFNPVDFYSNISGIMVGILLPKYTLKKIFATPE